MQVLAEDVLPALKRAPSSHPDSAPAVDFACLPLGFTTGGSWSHIMHISAAKAGTPVQNASKGWRRLPVSLKGSK